MTKQISALELRKHFGEITDEVHAQKQTYIVSKNGRPLMALVDIETYEKLIDAKSAPQSAPREASESSAEDAFIENYSKERMAEFLQEDSV